MLAYMTAKKGEGGQVFSPSLGGELKDVDDLMA